MAVELAITFRVPLRQVEKGILPGCGRFSILGKTERNGSVLTFYSAEVRTVDLVKRRVIFDSPEFVSIDNQEIRIQWRGLRMVLHADAVKSVRLVPRISPSSRFATKLP
jgi:hypothetical protein